MKTKNVVGVMMMALTVLGGFQAKAADNDSQLKNRFYVSVGAGRAIGTEKQNTEVSMDREYAHYWEADLNAGYKWYFHKGFFLSPEVGAFALYFNENKDGNFSKLEAGTYSFYGFNVNALVGCTFTNAVLPVDVFTGVASQVGFSANDVDLDYYKQKSTIGGAAWRFGFGLNPGRFSVRLMYDIRMGNNVHKEEVQYLGRGSRSIDGVDGYKTHFRMLNKLSLSVAYNF